MDGFAGELLAWYEVQRRDLPWRGQQDPYKVWVSEVMLQQTRVETVIPYYNRFLDRFPTLEALARAREEEVLQLWAGLGYYSRARNLQAAVREVVSRYGGEVPRNPDALRGLPGVGDYTAGALLSLAFNKAVPAVDGNVLRVVARLDGIEKPVNHPAVHRRVRDRVRELMPGDQASAFNQALMELGALVCLPRQPRCGVCPVLRYCEARKRDLTGEIPHKSRKAAPRPVDLVAAVIWQKESLLLVQRPPTGLLADLWELPSGERKTSESWHEGVTRVLEEEFNLNAEVDQLLARGRHEFSHLRWNIRVYGVCHWRWQEAGPNRPTRWLPRHEWDSVPIATAFKRLLSQL